MPGTIEERLAKVESCIGRLEQCAAKMVDVVMKLQRQIGPASESTPNGAAQSTSTLTQIPETITGGGGSIAVQFLMQLKATSASATDVGEAAEALWPLFKALTQGKPCPCVQRFLDEIGALLESADLPQAQQVTIHNVMLTLTNRLRGQTH
jgi:hypothetical protein